MIAKDKTTKLISASLIVSMLLPAVLLLNPKQAEAALPIGVPVNDVVAQATLLDIAGNTTISSATDTKSWAQKLLELLLMVAAKRFLAQMTQATVNWINSGFHGAPLFIENPGSFFKDISKSELRSLIDMIGYDTLRFPFGKDIALQVIASYKSQLETNAQYTLSKVIYDPDLLVRYRNDFNIGGWNGFLINTQYPQNNYLGFNMIIQQNLASRLEGTLMAPAQQVKDILQQGMGFLSPQTCPSNPKYNNGTNEFLKPSFKSTVEYVPPSPEPADTYLERDRAARAAYQNNKNVEKAKYMEENTCPGGLVSTTPGSVAANQIFNALDTPRESTTLAGALGNSVVDSVAAIFDALIGKLFSTGLNALSSTINPEPSVDNWSYNGQTLDGGYNYNTTTAGTLNIPQNVSVRVGESTSTAISGGTAPYVIINKTQPYLLEPKLDATVTNAQITGATLRVTGVGSGQTVAMIRDSSFPNKIVRVKITVNAVGALAAFPASISTGINEPTTAIINGGEGPYFVRIEPDNSIAVANFADGNLIITGLKKGDTFIEIEDSSSGTKKTVRIPIVINGPEDLVIQQNVLANVGEEVSIPISGGMAPYAVTNQQDVRVANAQILPATPNTLTINGILKGQTEIRVEDSSTPKKAVIVSVTVN
ncbi:MAG: hypothetical protein WC735_03585 [Candidatus Paceibacterota bacterium]|jgi:hypothetical protein